MCMCLEVYKLCEMKRRQQKRGEHYNNQPILSCVTADENPSLYLHHLQDNKSVKYLMECNS